jgi:acetyltransferase-like isoleucine patch superfamily enzyme
MKDELCDRIRKNIHPTATVDTDVSIGEGTKIWHYAHIRERVKIGKDCVIGKDVYIDHDVEIGNGCKIENGVSVYNGVILEDDVFLGPNVTLTNDKYPRSFVHDWKIMPTIIRKGVGVGAGAMIICGVDIGMYALVGAGSVVTTDIPAYALVYGNPAKFVSWVCKCGQVKTDSQGKLCPDCSKKEFQEMLFEGEADY